MKHKSKKQNENRKKCNKPNRMNNETKNNLNTSKMNALISIKKLQIANDMKWIINRNATFYYIFFFVLL